MTRLKDFSVWHTPGVAGPCGKILEQGMDASFGYTLRWNYAAVVSEDTRALGLAI